MVVGSNYDLKVGYTCNNNCFHCVIEPNRINCKKTNKKLDCTYRELISIMNTKEFKDAESVTITGGEPTIRKEFLRIIKYIHTNYPEKQISLQTNGRELHKYIDDIYNLGINMHYVIALHGYNEETHNKIANSRSGGNPYKETWKTLNKIKQVYKDFNKVARIEIVMSRLNLEEIPKLVEYLYQNDIKNIGISYPHLDGWYFIDKKIVREKGFSYKELRPILEELYNLALKYKDLVLLLEEVPKCVWRNKEGKLLKDLPNIQDMTHDTKTNVVVKFPETELIDNFSDIFIKMHKQTEKCKECIYCCSCVGIWAESYDVFGSEGIIPIKQWEIKGV